MAVRAVLDLVSLVSVVNKVVVYCLYVDISGNFSKLEKKIANSLLKK